MKQKYEYRAVVLKLDPVELSSASNRVRIKLNEIAEDGFRLAFSHMDMDRETPISLFIMERSLEPEEPSEA